MKNGPKIIIVLTVILVTSLFVYAAIFHEKKNNKIFAIENSLETVKKETTPKDYLVEFASNNNLDPDDIVQYNINEKYINYYNLNDKKTVIYDNENKDEASIDNLIIENQLENFKTLINTEINIKYPKFISDELIKDTTNKQYYFDASGITIYFNNYTTNPIYEGETSIKLTCSMLKEMINSNCTISTEEDPNIVKIDASKPAVAITFDDGPNYNTRRVLQILNDNKATATFFMLGSNMRNFPKIVKEVADTNNEIASHTYSHKYLTKLDAQALKYEITRPQEVLSGIVDKKIEYIRPPYGSINDNVKKAVETPIILWSLDTQDWRFRNAETIKQNVLDDIKDGDIILLHDIHSTTADGLELVLPELYVLGYQVVSVGELANLKGVNMINGNIYRNFR